jgi:hypothetical protein
MDEFEPEDTSDDEVDEDPLATGVVADEAEDPR